MINKIIAIPLKERVMTKDELAISQQNIQRIFEQYGLTLIILYSALNVASIAIDRLRSLDEKYNLVRRFGLDRIW